MEITVPVETLPAFAVGPLGSSARFFHGEQHDVSAASLMLGTLQPGEGPAWHAHPYDEIFVIREGRARFFIGSDVTESAGEHLVIARAGVPHRFENIGSTVLEMIAVHAAPKVIIEWLDPPAG